MAFIFAAVIVRRSIDTRVFRGPESEPALVTSGAKALAAASLVCWLGAITAGRLLAYVGPVSGL